MATVSSASGGTDAPTLTLRIGTRGSALALWQTERVIDLLTSRNPGLACEVQVISTHGDRDKVTPLSVIGGQGVFIKELESAILNGNVDCAVHSLKDMPSLLPENLVLGAILERDDPRDILVSRHPAGLTGLPSGARVGTSSRRRIAQLREVRPDVEPVELRGNIDTRISRVLGDDPTHDAAILAAAGILRMQRDADVAEFLDIGVFTPAPGQAALAVECREHDIATCALLATIHDKDVADLVDIERAFLGGIGGGCRSPIAALAQWEGSALRLRAMVSSEDLHQTLRIDEMLEPETAIDRASKIARELIESISN
jgi:hydroxymethylbilane synthase